MTAQLHNTVDIEVEVKWNALGPITATLHYRIFDPAHDDSDIAYRAFGVWGRVGDNVATGGFAAEPGAALLATEQAVTSLLPTSTNQMTISARRPGNNFIVAVGGNKAWLDAAILDSDRETILVKPERGPLSDTRQTEILTVWRTLTVEEDSMAAPGSFPNETPFASDGADNDDDHPGQLGTGGGVGDFAQPSLALLTSEFARAHIAVKVLSADFDLEDNLEFRHHLTNADMDYGEGVWDVTSRFDFWTVQVFAAYEGPENLDLDDPMEDGLTGNAHTSLSSPINIFLETLQDYPTDLVESTATGLRIPKDVDTQVQRTVVHEALHRFTYVLHDESMMDLGLDTYGSDEEVQLSPSLLWYLYVFDPAGSRQDF